MLERLTIRNFKAEDRLRAEAWREGVRRKIDEGFDETLRGELVDGEVVLERLRRRLEEGDRTKGA